MKALHESSPERLHNSTSASQQLLDEQVCDLQEADVKRSSVTGQTKLLTPIPSQGDRTLEAKSKRKDKDEETRKAEKKEERVVEITRTEEVSEQYQQKNPELLAKSLQLLGARISRRDSKEEILRKVLESYPDFSLADEALDFLLEIADADLAKVINKPKRISTLFTAEKFALEKTSKLRHTNSLRKPWQSTCLERSLPRCHRKTPRCSDPLHTTLGRFQLRQNEVGHRLLAPFSWQRPQNQRDLLSRVANSIAF